MTTETGSVTTGTPAGGTTTAGTTTTTTPQWFESPDLAEVTGWAKGRGYNLADMGEKALPALQGHFNAEKLIGLDRAGRTITLPKDDATPEEIEAFQAKLGRPATAKDYKLPAELKDDPVATAFLDVAHKAGFSQKQIDPLMQFIGAQQQQLVAQQQQQIEAKATADLQALQQEWGGEFQLRSEAARRAVRELGLSSEEATIVEETLGLKRTAEVFFKIGKGLLEDKGEGLGGNAGGGGVFGLSPTEARAKIDSLKKDTAFAGKLLAGDAGAKAEWERLHKTAWPD